MIPTSPSSALLAPSFDQFFQVEGLFRLTNGGVSTFLICIAIVLSKPVHGRYTLDHRLGPQKLHEYPTPRVGGLAIVMGLVISFAYAPIPVRELLKPMIIAGMPAFLFGLAEDLSRRVRWQERLLATICSGVLAWWLTGIVVTRVDVPLVDQLMSHAPFAVLFTAFALGGVANAFNMIDGLHGLSAGTAIICLAAFAAIAGLHGDGTLVHLSLMTALVLLGFLLVNFPLGKIFMGDGGAYLVGLSVGWVAVLLPVRNPDVSPWASLVILAYPVTEVLVSVLRRRLRAHIPAYPDRLHLHSLLQVRVSRKLFSKVSRDWQNALVAPSIWLGVSLSAVVGVMAHRHTGLLMLTLGVMVALYLVLYVNLIAFSGRINPLKKRSATK